MTLSRASITSLPSVGIEYTMPAYNNIVPLRRTLYRIRCWIYFWKLIDENEVLDLLFFFYFYKYRIFRI